MALRVRLLVLLLLCLPGITEAQTDPSVKNEITAAVLSKFPPHYSAGDDGKPAGFAIDVMDKITEGAGLKVHYVVKETWGEVIEELRSGRADLIPNLGITDKRKIYLEFTTTVETFPISIFIRKGTKDIHGSDDLLRHKVAPVSTWLTPTSFLGHSSVCTVMPNSAEPALALPLCSGLSLVTAARFGRMPR